MPIERAVPAMILAAASMSLALRSSIFCSAMARTWSAERVARAIANSQLVQTALYGRDPNWGRIAQAAGMALAGEELEELGPDRIESAELGAETPEAEISVRLSRGDASAHVYFSDLTYDYVRINAEYTT